MKWGLDGAFPPDNDEAAAVRELGWQFIAGYIGGKAFNVWRLDDWRRLSQAGFELLPIWVSPDTDSVSRAAGVDDGNQALIAMQSIGLAGTVALDVENGQVPLAYAAGFVDACHAGSCAVALYGTPDTIRGLGEIAFDHWWLASWPTPGMAVSEALPDWSIWQYRDGRRFDYNCAVDDFPFATLSH